MVGAGMDNTLRDDENCDNTGLGCALEMFSEVDEVIGIINNLHKIYNHSEFKLEGQYEKLNTILKQYYEQPHLLDPHLDKILNQFITILRDEKSAVKLKHYTFNYMYQIVRVRGYKVVIRHLPHEISDLHPVLTFLEEQKPEDSETWRSRFVLLLWLSIIVMMPFHMSRLDSFTPGDTDSEGEVKKTVMSRIFEICKTYSLVKDSCSEAGAFLASKFLTRSDVKELYLGTFFEWSRQQNESLQKQDNINYGVLASVATILKHGKREDILPYADTLLHWVTQQNYRQNKAILTRKYAVKIIQRIGLTFLRSRVAVWRYTRGSRSLATNLLAAGDTDAQINEKHNEDFKTVIANPDLDDEEDDQDIPEQLEEVIEQLLLGLRDNDNIVRWSAAKGLGRVAGRLSRATAGDVALSLMDLFHAREGPGAWHGGCLALAELGRRGLLLPNQLPEAVAVVLKALQYEEVRGHSATGQHVRDAACYVCWAFARAYDAAVLQPYVKQIAAGLIITAVFDREIHCRRAASAAFQENVGRQGSFPNGIDILTAADFFSVGVRNNAFLTVAPWVAQFSDYTYPLINHLIERKVDHWDIAIRELTSKALHKLTDKAPTFMAETALRLLIDKTTSIDVNARHGSILAIGEIFHALHLISLPNGQLADSLVSPQVLEAITNLVSMLNSKYQFRGMGGELMRQACCVCIEKLSISNFRFERIEVIDEWLILIDECLIHEVLTIREKAISALPTVFNEYLSDHSDNILKNGNCEMEVDSESDIVSLKEKRVKLLSRYCQQLGNTAPNGLHVRMGNALAIGALPAFVLEESLMMVIESLIRCTCLTDQTVKWAESRRDAVKGLSMVCLTVGTDKIKEALQLRSQSGIKKIFECFFNCLEEYTIDMRGDIGAWVREASISGLLSLCKQCASEDPSVLTPNLVSRVVTGIAQQSVEKIDRTRAYAGKVFTTLLHVEPAIPHIPHHAELLEIFPLPPDDFFNATVSGSPDKTSAVLWLFAEHTMPLFVRLLDWEEYRYSVILGLTVSVGDITENLVKHSTAALFSYLGTIQDDDQKLKSICDTIVQVFINNHKINRIIIPMLSFLDRLLSTGSVSSVLLDPSNSFAHEILKHVKLEMVGCSNFYKHLNAISVLCQLIQVGGAICRAALSKLVICICNSEKYIRKSTAIRLYDGLLIYGDMAGVSEEIVDEAMRIIAETNWELEVTALRPIRNSICDLLAIEKPITIKKSNFTNLQ